MASTTCLCGEIEFQVTGLFGEVRYCHCSQCRKVTGTAFSANAKVERCHWRIIKGDGFITEYEQAPGIFRAFCGKCGSPLYSRLDREPNHIRVRLGSFHDPEGVNVTGHVWVSSKASWFDIPESDICFEKGRTD